MYTFEKPAHTLQQVIDHLKRQHNANFVYRGQTAEYKAMLPSFCRNRSLEKAGDFLIFPMDAESTRVENIKGTFAYVLVTKFGNVAGNYLAQQYLAKSGCIDVTEDIDVAAFFAKMKYPQYDDPLEDEQQLGVIYRFNKAAFTKNIQPGGVKENPFDPMAGPANYSVFLSAGAVSNLSIKDYPFAIQKDDSSKYYLLLENLSTYSDLRQFLDEIETNHRLTGGIGREAQGNLFHRAKAQSGGMIQPLYLCRYPENNQVDHHFGDVIGLEDMYNKYAMEKFYFRHSRAKLLYNRENIWPSVDSDMTFAILCSIFMAAKAENRIEPDISMTDIIDIGYEGNIPPNWSNS